MGEEERTFEDGGGGEEGLDIRCAEGVGAGLDGGGAGGSQTLGQEVDVGGLVRANRLDVVVEGGVVAGGSEIGLGVVRKAFLVESILKVLEGEGILENIGISRCGLALLGGSGHRETRKGSNSGGVLHFVKKVKGRDELLSNCEEVKTGELDDWRLMEWWIPQKSLYISAVY